MYKPYFETSKAVKFYALIRDGIIDVWGSEIFLK